MDDFKTISENLWRKRSKLVFCRSIKESWFENKECFTNSFYQHRKVVSGGSQYSRLLWLFGWPWIISSSSVGGVLADLSAQVLLDDDSHTQELAWHHFMLPEKVQTPYCKFLVPKFLNVWSSCILFGTILATHTAWIFNVN